MEKLKENLAGLLKKLGLLKKDLSVLKKPTKLCLKDGLE